jgi:AcrR family transcriptional regulator
MSAPDLAQPSARDRILADALRLFAAQGFDATPIRQVADEAGVATGLIYYHFGDKAGLLRAIFERSLAQVEASLDDATAAAGKGVEAGLDRLVRTALAAVARELDFWRLSYQLRMQRGVSATLEGALAGWSAEIRSRIEGILAAGHHPDPAPAAWALFAAVDGAAQHFAMDPDHYPLDPVVEALVRAFAPSPSLRPREARSAGPAAPEAGGAATAAPQGGRGDGRCPPSSGSRVPSRRSSP